MMGYRGEGYDHPLWECPHCGYEYCDGYLLYCPSCGKFIYNTCTNPKCDNGCFHDEYISSGDFDEETGLGTLPPDSRFCPLCGCKSVFFEDGLIP